MSTFRMVPDPEVVDLSTEDEIRYRVRCRILTLGGVYLGSGIGECSTDEEKYRWRKAVCDEEWREAPEDRRREKWSKGGGQAYKTKQVRTNPADVANTVLKMAKKRSLVDGVLTITAASDIFTQDLEDLPEEVRDEVVGQQGARPANASSSPEPAPGDKISEAQSKRLYAIYKGAGKTDDQVKAYIKARYGLTTSKDITKGIYEELCEWAKNPAPAEPGSNG